MAKSRFEYVRNYELPDPLMPNTFIVVRVDGRGFHKFSDAHAFDKPNDVRALHLMDIAAKTVMNEYKDVIMAFGESDEYSFLVRRSTKLYNRRRSKISSSIVSLFTSAYVFNWSALFPNQAMEYPPSFDSRVVLYPTAKEVRDYFSWRQADTHINNLYNTAFWALVKGGQTTTEANKTLQGTDSKDKNEMLFSTYGINYNTLPAMYRKGSICVRRPVSARADVNAGSVPGQDRANVQAGSSSRTRPLEDGVEGEAPSSEQTSASTSTTTATGSATIEQESESDVGPTTIGRRQRRPKEKKFKAYEGTEGEIVVVHEDIIGNTFWEERPWLLA